MKVPDSLFTLGDFVRESPVNPKSENRGEQKKKKMLGYCMWSMLFWSIEIAPCPEDLGACPV